MTGPEFRAALARLELSQRAFCRLVESLGGQRLHPVTVWRWCDGRQPVPPLAAALVALLEEHQLTTH